MSGSHPPQPPPLPENMVARPISRLASSSSKVERTAENERSARQRMTDRKREWRRNRSDAEIQRARQRDAERKRELRKQMTPEQRAKEREKDAERKARKRRKEKENRLRAAAMSVTRILNE